MKRRYLSNRITRFAAEMALCLTLLLICGNTAAAAEDETIRSEYSYRRYTTADGLHSMRNKYILQDGKGFIWIAGRTGLSRYDGFEFKSWLKDKDANIFKLDKDEGGRIRAFSDNLIYSVDEQADTLVCTVISQSRYEISAYSSRDLPDGYGIFGKNKSQALYAISDTGLVMIVEHERLTDFQYTNTTFYDTEKNQLYLPCEDTVHVINGHTLVASYPMTAGSFCLYGDAVLALAEDGIYTLKEGRAECIFRHEISILETPSKIYADTNGDIFFCAKTGLFRLRENRIDTLLTAVTLADFLIDREHNLWAVTYEGLFNLFRLEFSNYVFSLADSEDVFRTVVYQEESDAVIAGTLNGRVYEIRDAGARIRRLSFPQSRYNVSFFLDYSIATPDAVYLPGPGDVLKLGRNLKQWIGLPYHPQCRFVVRLPDGNLIAGGAQQLFLFTPDGKLLKEFGQSSVKQEVYAKPCTDRQGRLWLGGRSGVTIYDLAADSVHVTLFNDGMRMCNHMDTDRKGNVWFTSENRLFIATDDTVQLKHTFDRMIAGLYFTRREDRLIVSTLGGIHIFDENMEDHVFYNHENGYTGIEVFSGAMAEDALGNIWLPSLSGLVCFNPARLMRRQPKPDMLLLSTASSTDNIHWLYVGISNLKLNHQRRNIRFDYIGLSYTSAQNIRYRYRLLGFQDEWSEPVKQREVTFNNLPPGDYTFEIYADAGTDESRSET
ncbi:MAG: hypothetical protein LBJ47_05890, partial [Tannerella sp.]|nr:hypothetical protein [Tannerella sp.]